MSELPVPPGPGSIDPEVRRAYLEHAAAVHRHAARAALGDHAAAHDATQQAFIEAVAIWPLFRQWTPGISAEWLCAAARSRVIDSWRKAGREVPADTLPAAGELPDAEAIAVSALALDRFWKAVTAMPRRQAKAAYLRWHENWTMPQIAGHLGVDRATVLQPARG